MIPEDGWLLVDGTSPRASRWALALIALFLGFAAWNLVGVARMLKRVRDGGSSAPPNDAPPAEASPRRHLINRRYRPASSVGRARVPEYAPRGLPSCEPVSPVSETPSALAFLRWPLAALHQGTRGGTARSARNAQSHLRQRRQDCRGRQRFPPHQRHRDRSRHLHVPRRVRGHRHRRLQRLGEGRARCALAAGLDGPKPRQHPRMEAPGESRARPR